MNIVRNYCPSRASVYNVMESTAKVVLPLALALPSLHTYIHEYGHYWAMKLLYILLH